MQDRRIVAMGGGGFSMEPENLRLDDFVLSLSRRSRPRVCFVPTASGDSDGYIARFYRAFCQLDCQATDLQLFERTVQDLESFVLDQDVIYVGGGSTANLLAIWRTHGLDRILERAWKEGVVLCGLSAGMNCWFEQSLTDSFDLNGLAPLRDGLGFLAGSCCPHYDGEPLRRPTYRQLIRAGELLEGWAADDGAAIVFDDEGMDRAVASRPNAKIYRVYQTSNGVSEQAIEPGYLGR